MPAGGPSFPSLIRKALAAAGYPQVEVLTWNVKGLERDHALPLRPEMVWRALFGLFYGDLLLLLTLQTRPYEAVAGAANACRDRWTNQLAGELRSGAPLTLRRMKEVFHQAAGDFAALPRRPVARKRVALVGELYTKYCALGNWDILPFLEEAGCEVAVNGFSWYILYYISSQIAGTTGPVQALWRGLGAWMAGLQRTMTAALAAHGFHSLPPFPAFQREAADWISQTLRVADGWLIGAECAAHIHAGCHRVLAMQPFGCLPNHVCGRGQYAALLRRLGRGKAGQCGPGRQPAPPAGVQPGQAPAGGRGMRKTLSEPQGFGEGFVLFVQSILVERYSVCLGIGSEEPLGGLPVGFFHIYQVIPVLLHLV